SLRKCLITSTLLEVGYPSRSPLPSLSLAPSLALQSPVMSLELLFLGTGTSAGVPMIGCDCEVCRSTDPRDQRMRPSALIRYPDPGEPRLGQRQLLLDTATEMRLQIIRNGIRHIDGVLY